jgi:hypothetical protein
VFWLPIPVMWVCFPFLVSSGIAPPELILPLFVVLTIIISALGAAVLPSPVPKDAPLAYGRHATPLLPAAPPATPPPQPAGDPLVAGARRALIGLQAAVTAHAELAAPARQDLEATIRALTGEVDAAERGLTAVSAALDGHGPPVDGRSAAARLERLDALERAGQVADPSERARLRRIVTHVREAEVARGELEDRQAAARAHLLEVAAVAERTRVELASAAVPAMSGRLARQLRSDADAVAAARHELAGRQRAPER